ncbi:MAG: diguanylate cyclase [Planctomycetales bacterium]
MSPIESLHSRLMSPARPVLGICHPTDSSRILLGLMSLAKSLPNETNERGQEILPRSVLHGLLMTLQMRDERTARHSRRVAMLATGVAQQLGWSPEQLRQLETAALLHDIGKIGVPDSILNKPGELSHNEADLINLFQSVGCSVLQACRIPASVIRILQTHRMFCSPGADVLRRTGSDIPLGARILAVADAYDSLGTEQVYRKAKKHEQIMEVLREHSGQQFDGNVVNTLERWFENEKGQTNVQSSFDPLISFDSLDARTDDELLLVSIINQIFSHLYLLHELYDGFTLVDSDMRYVVWSLGLELSLGYCPEEMLGQLWSQRKLACANLEGEPLKEGEDPLLQVIESHSSVNSHLKVRHKDGSYRQLDLQCIPLCDDEGRLHGVAEIFLNPMAPSRQGREIQQLRMAANCDALTSVLNRGSLETQMALALESARRPENPWPFSLIYMDIDHFKKINDTYGHAVGDIVLKQTAQILQKETYSGEIVGRYGGEEFVIVCPETDLESATSKSERFRVAISQMKIPELKGEIVTASFGVAQWEDQESLETVKERADTGLYQSKQNGRNCTTSLTAEQFIGLKHHPKGHKRGEGDFYFEASFDVLTVAEVIGHKLGGFLEDNHAKLLDATRKLIRFRMGRPFMMMFWGRTPESQPIEVEVLLGEPQATGRSTRSSIQRIGVTVCVRPRGVINDPHRFQLRAKGAFKDIKAYFAAEV